MGNPTMLRLSAESLLHQENTPTSAKNCTYRQHPILCQPLDIPRTMDLVEPQLRDVLRACAAGRSPWPLLLHGSAGTGKTCAALSLADYVIGSRVYHLMTDLLDDLIAAMKGELFDHDGDKVASRRIWHEWTEADMAILDDIGCRDRVSDHHYETLKSALDRRRGPSIYLSNVSPDAIARLYDDRIASRLCAGTVFECVGVDRRIAGESATVNPATARIASIAENSGLAELAHVRAAKLDYERQQALVGARRWARRLSPDELANPAIARIVADLEQATGQTLRQDAK